MVQAFAGKMLRPYNASSKICQVRGDLMKGICPKCPMNYSFPGRTCHSSLMRAFKCAWVVAVVLTISLSAAAQETPPTLAGQLTAFEKANSAVTAALDAVQGAVAREKAADRLKPGRPEPNYVNFL